MKLVKTTAVPATICDPSVKLSVVGAFDLVQDYLTDMMGKLGIDGVSLRKKYGCVWIFTRNKLVFDKNLLWMQSYTAESYISSAKGAKLTVDTALKDENGNIAVYSRVEMCALHLESQKIRRVSDMDVTPDMVYAPEKEISFSRLRHGELEKADAVRVRSCDIDFIRHTNNISYIRYLMNTYSVQELCDRPVKEIEVRYLGQTHEGDSLDIYKGEENGREIFRIALGDMTAVECEVLR